MFETKLHVFIPSIPLCALINQHMSQLARKFPQTKFLKSISTTCIPNYPDRNLPTIFVYLEGEMKAQFIGPLVFGGMNLKVEGESCFSLRLPLPQLLEDSQITLFSGRAGVEVIGDRSGEDRPGGEPQETNRRQADVIDQVFYSHEKRQWLRGRGGRLKRRNQLRRPWKLALTLVWEAEASWQPCPLRDTGMKPWCWISAVDFKAGITRGWTLTNTRHRFETLFIITRLLCQKMYMYISVSYIKLQFTSLPK